MRYKVDNKNGTFSVFEDGKLVLANVDERVAIADLWAHHGALVAAATDPLEEIPFVLDPLILEDVETGDGRYIAPNALTFRDFPLPYMQQTSTAWGHDGAVIAGRIDTLTRVGNKINGTGVLLGEPGAEAAQWIASGALTGVSADLDAVSVEVQITEVDDEGYPISWREDLIEGRVMGGTGTPFPAFAEAKVRLTGGDSAAADDTDPPVDEALAEDAVAASGVLNPPPTAFDDPKLDGPTHLTVTDDGRIFGHLATWGTCHIGRDDVCITPPTSYASYAYFRTGAVKCEDGCEIPTGVLTMGTGHADLRNGAAAATAHYDETGTGVADVATGEDQYGIWVAGAIRPGVSDEDIELLRGSDVSGDWRKIGGHLELVAILAVNVAGFPMPRAMAASGDQISLVAAGVMPQPNPSALAETRMREEVADLRREVAEIRGAFSPLVGLSIQASRERLAALATKD